MDDYHEVANDRRGLENDYVVECDHPAAGKIKVMGYPVRFSKTPAQVKSEAPEFGQHTEEVLLEDGQFTWEEIAALRDEGVI